MTIKAIARYLILEAFDVVRHLEINVKIKHALIINDKKLPKTILGNTSWKDSTLHLSVFECGKIMIRKTPSKDTSYVVTCSKLAKHPRHKTEFERT